MKIVWNSVLLSFKNVTNWKSALDKHESDCALFMIFFLLDMVVEGDENMTDKYGTENITKICSTFVLQNKYIVTISSKCYSRLCEIMDENKVK